ncbi:MAG: hypothetical protein JO140_01150 [Candidatus Eremiobacteraeota bacterium]|nr:hypothetical protein [Candidatus Eremiobacteraeota bacterium]
MLAPLVLIVAIASSGLPSDPGTAASPAPSAAPAGSAAAGKEQLKEIGRVTSNAMCTAIVMRANSAIGATLRNDQTVGIAIQTLRHVDLDTHNSIDKRKAMSDIGKLSDELRSSAGSAEEQIKKLREMSEQATDPTRKADLKEFADALGGALNRQKRIGADLARMLVIIEGRDARVEAHRDIAYSNPGGLTPWRVWDAEFDTMHYNSMARAAAKEVEDRTLSIAADESKAADHIVGAVNGCN